MHNRGKLPDDWTEETDQSGVRHWFRRYRDTAHILELYEDDIFDDKNWFRKKLTQDRVDRIRKGCGEDYAIQRATELATEIETAMDPSDYMGFSRRRKRVWSDSDGEPCADRIVAERDEWMQYFKPGAKARVFRLGMNIVCSRANQGRNDPDSPYIAMAATLAATATAISRLGHGVEIVGFSGIWNSPTYQDGYLIDSWPIKRADEPLDIAKVCVLGIQALHTGVILGGTRYPGNAMRSSEYTKQRLGIDYLFERSWHRDSSGKLVQSDVREGLQGILATAQVRE